MIRERKATTAAGILMMLILLIVMVLSVVLFINSVQHPAAGAIIVSILLFLVDLLLFFGLFNVNPNEGVVIQLFGKYTGTAKSPGLRWVNPFCTRHRVSLRVRNFESGKLKVNDNDGNPIEIAAVVVWKVTDTAEAVFEVDSYENFVEVQSEAALRNLATSYPYDAHDDDHVALRSHTNQIADHLKTEVQDRLSKAGVEVIESRISHLAYAPEIASAMLQRQQASAIIAARQKIVEGAVGMVEMALDQLSKQNVVELDEEKKAAMVSNLLVVLCGNQDAQPVVNTGTIYH
ncbi:SPFH domain-containing protein [Candidatus Eisenbacteria bacterium]|uniref:SPFH domain-containing protein n=1 Tax=Eiseniibacteriota bacterium TaxID=2212470 RepID=A0ABV6YI99_UNCEI